MEFNRIKKKIKLIDNLEYFKITNPDGYKMKWVHKIKNNYLYPYLTVNTKDMYSHKNNLLLLDNNMNCVKFIKKNDEIYKEFRKKLKNISQYYHPNEIFSIMLTDIIIYKNSTYSFKNLNKLLKNINLKKNKYLY